MNRTIKDATVKRCFYETQNQLRIHLRDFVDAYNFARRLKTLAGLTHTKFICKTWTAQPSRPGRAFVFSMACRGSGHGRSCLPNAPASAAPLMPIIRSCWPRFLRNSKAGSLVLEARG